MTIHTPPPLAVANSARAAADMVRAAALVDLANGHRSVADIVKTAASDEGRPLLRLSIRQLLLAQPGWGEDRARAVIEKMLAVTNSSPKRVTLAWVLDPRAAGRRFMAFCDALHPNDATPWPGFPYSPNPTYSPNHRSAS